jgi:hypothetical protein
MKPVEAATIAFFRSNDYDSLSPDPKKRPDSEPDNNYY